jgi:hypothetical protein
LVVGDSDGGVHDVQQLADRDGRGLGVFVRSSFPVM